LLQIRNEHSKEVIPPRRETNMSEKKCVVYPVSSPGPGGDCTAAVDGEHNTQVLAEITQFQCVMVDTTTQQRIKPVAHVKPMIADTSQQLIPSSSSPSASQLSPNLSHKTSTTEQLKTPTLSNRQVLTATKAKKCRFFRNGDRFFKGVCVAISSERYRTLDSVAEEVTRALLGTGCVLLPSGVRVLYALADGRKVHVTILLLN
jgi:hypothetical protein